MTTGVGHLVEAGARLRAERDRLHCNQADFGAWGGVTRNSQQAYESGRRAFDADYAIQLAAHEVDIGYVITGRRSSGMIEDDQVELLASYAAIEPSDQVSLLHVAAAMAGRSRPQLSIETEQPALTLPPEEALERMFVGLLRSMPNVSEDELAHGLAKLLPTGLRTVQGPLRYEASDDPDDSDGDAPYRGATDRALRRA